MKLNQKDYALECASDGGYYAWSAVNAPCTIYNESPEESFLNLQETINEIIDGMYLVEDFV